MAEAQTTEGATQVVEAVRFSFMTDDEVRRHSLVEVTRTELLDNTGVPVPGGLYDPIMGPLPPDDKNKKPTCKSCDQSGFDCPGHCGHIELIRQVYHPLLFNVLHSLLQMTCFECHCFIKGKEEVKRCASQLKLIIKGDIIGAKQFDPGSESVFSHSENSDQSLESNATIDSLEKCEDPEVIKQRWTSLQFSEANNVLNKFMKLTTNKKCKNCKYKNQVKKDQHMHGWFQWGPMSGSSIRGNEIRRHTERMTSGGVKNPEEFGYDGIDGQSEFEDSAKGKQRETATYVKPKKSASEHLLPNEVKEVLKELWENESEICSFIGDLRHNGSERVDYNMFFLGSVLVPPTKSRPPAQSGGTVMEHPQTVSLIKVLQANISLRDARDKKDRGPNFEIARWRDLQGSINALFDSKTATAKPQKDVPGICQLLEKKEGLFRSKMMGKRVNYACRSVISPDPYIAVNEIGIPPYFALNLTYPERVTPWNVEKLREAIINGPGVHPGATHYFDGLPPVKLLPRSREERIAVARRLLSSRGTAVEPGKAGELDLKGKFVHRHMQDGDIVVVNRQPTLHKPSIMAHKVRVLKGEKTLRLHYANCSTYNADFDGDEMNVHFPQDEISRAEAYNIVNANNQYVRPSNGDPLRTLIQDHIVSAVLLTKRDTFLDKDQFNQLFFSSGVSDMVISSFPGKSGKKVSVRASDVKLLAIEPAILKPMPLWTGKQVIAAVLNHITRDRPPFSVEKAAKLPVVFFKCSSRELKSRSTQIGGKGQLIRKCGTNESWKRELDEDKLLIRKNYFVRGVIDKAQFADYGLIHTVQELYGSNTAGDLLSVLSRLFTVFLQMHGFTCGVDDLIIKKDMDDKRTKQLEECEHVGERALRKALGIGVDVQIDPKDLKFRIEKIICSGGEGASASLDRSTVNELNQCTSKGVMNDLLSDGLLKSTGKNCISLMTISGAKGSKVNFQQISSHLGQQELEGKRVPRMVSGKTLPCFHPWDWSPRAGGFISDRFLSGLRPQEYYFHCMAGREGLVDTAVKTSHSGYLQRSLMKNLESLKVNYDYTVRDADGSIVQFQYGEDGVDVHRTSFIGKFKELTANHDMILQRFSDDELSGSNCYIADLPLTLKKQAEEFVERLPLNERVASKLVKQEQLLKLVKSKFFASLAQPGESVGVLAAQSVGEPSTQMTLNTFHLAGRGEMNVTLGIPRLREILMTASSDIKTPIMTCPLLKGETEDDVNVIVDKLRKITLADILEDMEVSVEPFALHGKEVCSIHKLKMKLYKPEHYPKRKLEETMMGVFLRGIEDAIQNHVAFRERMRGIMNVTTQEAQPKARVGADEDASVSEKRDGGQDDDGDDNDDGGDGQDIDDLGSDAQKRRRQATDEVDYEENSDEEKSELSSITGMGDPEVDNNDENMEISKGDPVGDDNERTRISQSHDEMSKPEEPAKAGKKIEPGMKRKDSDRNIKVEFNGKEFEVHFKFTKEPHILLAEIAQKTAQNVHVQNSGKIERCNVVDCSDPQVIYHGENSKERKDVSMEEKKATPALNAAGIGFNAFWELQDELDVRYLYSNNVHAILNTYGVEAARETIIREINHVFKSYGISVSIRHLSLIADYMTHSGGYRPMNRVGGVADSTSPFLRMTTETASRFLVDASKYGEVDHLETPSSRICLGLPVRSGTGCFELMQKLEL